MKVLVPVKRVVDYNVKIRVKADGSGVELANVKMSMNPFDEIAVEEALRLKEAGKATEVVVVSIGPAQAAETLRTGLAMGADRGILVKTDGTVEPLAVAKILKAVVEQGGARPRHPRQAGDRRRHATRPARCWPRCSAGRRAPSPPRSSSATARLDVTREVDGGLQTVTLKLPAIVTTDLRLNEPRYASLPNIMKAKKKPLDETVARGARRRRRAAAQGAEDGRAAGAQGRRQGRLGGRARRQAQERSRRDLRRREGSIDMTTLLIAEHDNAGLKDVTAKALTAAAAARRAGRMCSSPAQARTAAAEAAAKLDGVEKVLLADGARLRPRLAEPMAALIVVARRRLRRHRRAGDRRPARTCMPRVAALLDVMQVSDIIKVVSPDTFERPIYAGNAIQTVQSTDAKKVITVRTASFQAAGEGGSAPIEAVAAAADPGALDLQGRGARQVRPAGADLGQDHHLGRPRACGTAENFTTYIEPVADKLGAAMGASRAAVDAGYAPNDWQVGQTGKVVAPDLYIAVGISGAIQHLAGMKDSKVIVAINKDEEAPIFQVADYGLVGDLFQILPELEDELDKAGPVAVGCGHAQSRRRAWSRPDGCLDRIASAVAIEAAGRIGNGQ